MREITALLLLLSCSTVLADWVKTHEIADSGAGPYQTDGYSLYVDVDRIGKSGNFRKIWVIQELNMRAVSTYELSRRSLFEIDCKEERFRTLSVTSHSDSMATGDTISRDDSVSTWNHMPPNTPSEDLFKFACQK